jgi:hypothetical protein
MIIQANSPFRNLPANLDHKQILFFDGIRYAVEMIDVAYSRLRTTLNQLSYLDLSDKKVKADVSVMSLKSSVFLDAWSIVDSINRYRVLINQMPNLKRRDFGIDKFMQRTDTVLKLRNGVQHLPKEIHKLVQKNLPVWGALSWFAIIDIQAQIGRSCILGAGTFRQHLSTMKIPVGKTIQAPIDCIVLSAYENDFELTEAVNLSFDLFREIERSLIKKIEGQETTESDFQMYLDLKFKDEVTEGSLTNEYLYTKIDKI